MDRWGSPWRWTPGHGRVALDVELNPGRIALDVELDLEVVELAVERDLEGVELAVELDVERDLEGVELDAGRIASGHWRPWSSAPPSCGVSRPTRRGGGARLPSPPLSALLSLRHYDDTLPS